MHILPSLHDPHPLTTPPVVESPHRHHDVLTRNSRAILGVDGGLFAEPGAVGIDAAQGVGTAECHDLLVAEAHAVEDVLQMLPRGWGLVRKRGCRGCARDACVRVQTA